MSFVQLLDQFEGLPFWSIALATNIGTSLANETTAPRIEVSLRRARVEEEYAAKYQRIREPISGYNCFGHVFAWRRTAIKNFDLSLLVTEDGIGEIEGENAKIGDIVLYSDKDGPTHAARIVELRTLAGQTVCIVLSKFDDVSGEYQHRLTDTSWAEKPLDISWRFFRERMRDPRPFKTFAQSLLGG